MGRIVITLFVFLISFSSFSSCFKTGYKKEAIEDFSWSSLYKLPKSDFLSKVVKADYRKCDDEELQFSRKQLLTYIGKAFAKVNDNDNNLYNYDGIRRDTWIAVPRIGIMKTSINGIDIELNRRENKRQFDAIMLQLK